MPLHLSLAPFVGVVHVQEPGVLRPDSRVPRNVFDAVVVCLHPGKEELAAYVRASPVDAAHFACDRFEAAGLPPADEARVTKIAAAYRENWAREHGSAKVSPGTAPPLQDMLRRGLETANRNEREGIKEDPPEARFKVLDYGGAKKISEGFESALASLGSEPPPPTKGAIMTTAGDVVNSHRFASTWLYPATPIPDDVPGSPSQPVGMLNLLKFRPGGGEASYKAYTRAVARYAVPLGAMLAFPLAGFSLREVRRSGSAVEVGKAVVWDEFLVMEYPSSYVFAGMTGSKGFREIEPLRRGGLVDSTIFATFREEVPETIRAKL
ncbi:hypothetical protein DFJ74DRAFT_122202 [Hyaloraphidium curvatum]|nr:hypothetical protein DFJ74DRAFT_122202 [Hyaloraphidium curvatum]